MSGGWQGSTRASRLPPDWEKRRAMVLARDGHRCTVTTEVGRCPAPAEEVDHIKPGDNHDPTNLAAVCAACHKVKTNAEAAAARRIRPTGKRPPEKHPGLL